MHSKIYYILIFTILISSCNQTKSPQEKTDSMFPNEKVPTLEKATVASYQNISVAEFKKGIANSTDGVIMDVRTPEEIANGKIQGAIEIDFYDHDILAKLEALDKNKAYFLYCEMGGRSEKIAHLMAKNGFTKVHNLIGGYNAWSKNNN